MSKAKLEADKISGVMYPTKRLKSDGERTLMIKQRYFYVAASIKDILRRFKNRFKNPTERIEDFSELPLKASF